MRGIHFGWMASLLWMVVCQSCTGNSPNLPLVTPIIKSATPTGLGGTSRVLSQRVRQSVGAAPSSVGFSVQDIKDRFFSDGPTSVYSLLKAVDRTIADINIQSGDCITQTPVAYPINPFGETVTLYAQCYHLYPASTESNAGFFQFGVKDNLIYISSMGGQGRTAMIISPLDANGKPVAVPVVNPVRAPNSDYTPKPTLAKIASSYQVELWGGVGYLNGSVGCNNVKAWDGCSYGILHLIANTVTKTFELTVAGMGFGFCGASLKSDGTNIYVSGSLDAAGCQPTNSLCVAASDAITPATCGSELKKFGLNALGRKSAKSSGLAVTPQGTTGPDTYSASTYPADGGNVLLNGTSSDHLNFGPTAPTAGAGAL